MNEATIRQELARFWISKGDRRRLERQLALLQSSPAASGGSALRVTFSGRDAVSAPQVVTQTGSPRIDGSAAFTRATEKALALLKTTPSWSLASLVRGFKEIAPISSTINGYLQSGTFFVCPGIWKTSTIEYASTIVHEGAHAARGGRCGTEEEKIAYRAQVQALRELGASGSMIRFYEGHAANPTHHLGWAGPNNTGR